MVNLKRILFKNVRIGQLFYYNYRWYQRKSKLLAIYADSPDTEATRFKQTATVRIFSDLAPLPRPKGGLTFEEFINQAAT
jgi:hypothetical protein